MKLIGMKRLAPLLSVLVCLCIPALAAPDRPDVAAMAPREIGALQQRLKDAGCYQGDIDGTPSDATKTAVAACPDQRPQLRIETGMHTVAVSSIDVDADCKVAATASDDKSVRLWSLPDGRLLRVLRWPIGAGEGGKIYATAVSPDGRFVAAGGWDAGYDRTRATKISVTIFDATTGADVARISGFENVILHLAFSDDGRWLAATLGSDGVRMIDASNWGDVAADKAYGGSSYGAAFGPDGRLYTISLDGKIRRYAPGPAFDKELEVATRGGKQPFAIDIDPNGGRIAVGFDDSTAVDFYDARTLRYRGTAETRGLGNGNLMNVAARNDGRAWLSGGMYQNAGSTSALLFDHDGHRHSQPLPLAQNAIMDLKSCGDGFVVAAADPAFGLLNANGRKRLWRTGVTADMRNKLGDAFMVSADAKQVRFGLEESAATPVTFDLTNAKLTESPEAPSDLSAPKTDGLPVTDWQNTYQPRLAGQAIQLRQLETSHSLAIRPGNDGFILGAAFDLRAFGSSGQLRWKAAIPGDAWGVNLSADGQIIVAAYADGTIRWHRWSDGKELLALFVNKETRAWVTWTPSGYYMASPGGEDMIGWHVNRGWAQAADFFPASRFRDTYGRPDIVRLVLTTLDEDEAVARANADAHRRQDPTPLIERLPPVVAILSPTDGTSVAPGPLDISYSARSPSGGTVDRVEVFVDGAKARTRGLGRLQPAPGAEGQGTLTIDMPAHDAVISLVGYDGNRAGDAVSVKLVAAVAAKPPGGPDFLKPTLYALLVGVTHYADKDYDLGYPAADATAFAAALQSQKGKLYKDVVVKVLTDGDATSAAVKNGLYWLQGLMTDRDLAVVFVAGHGLTDAKSKFWFLTTDANPSRLLTTAVSRDDINDILFDLPGKKLLFIDACHAGAALEGGIRGGGTDISLAVQDFAQAEGGVVVYAASTGREFSREDDTWRHGYFTEALLEAIGQGKADLFHNGTITTATLDAFIANRVKELSGGTQHSVMNRPKTVPDFPLALAR